MIIKISNKHFIMDDKGNSSPISLYLTTIIQSINRTRTLGILPVIGILSL